MKNPQPSPAALEAILASLQEVLGYRFRDPGLLRLALGALQPSLTPEAAVARQRLEFLGDAAWNFAVATAAFQARPHAGAGDLTRLRATWCSTAGLARLARTLGLPTPQGNGTTEPTAEQAIGEWGNRGMGDRSPPLGSSDRDPAEMPAARSRAVADRPPAGPSDRVLAEMPAARSRAVDAKPPARPSDRVLAEMLEAALGAIIEDGGLDAVRALAQRVIAQESAGAAPAPVDPKSALQILAQGRCGILPAYRLLGRRGPAHQPTFRVRVTVTGQGGVEVRAEAEGSSRQAAEQEAARLALHQMDEAAEP